ncbi:hypothetical protein [Phaeobacter gallaeciensis]|uniref:hypothetical protein n=1 Tax=Phaeobacter gallaeciensis TaxID=60890 RepID=UPI00237EFB05|nr:hypothetical protein [Phaeobacter gallaeciensis]MDE4061950.1 hypothetical protein [Phaeobacter gallaeciensis]MDE4124861.1 hypothetical protein [Phaeobacter gallaeciensis]MDE4129334.1 hypothetical protein [Phaeobacter gallaeciensis]
MALFSALAGLAGSALSFIGGRKNRKSQEAMYAQDSYNNSPQGIRANAEEAGFNPLTVLTSGRSFGAGYAPVFGNEYAALGQGIDDALSGLTAERAQVSALETENARLQKLVQRNTLTPPVPGVYGARNANSKTPVSDLAGSQSNGSTGWVAPGRERDVAPYASGPGLTEISNAATDFVGGPVVVPGADGEPWGIDELATAIVAGTPQVLARGAWRFGEYIGEAVDRKRMERVWRDMRRKVEKKTRPQYDPKLNPPLRGYYGPPGSRTGF